MISKIFFILIFQIIRDVRRYLRNPDKLFRRVRDKHGNLRLSKAAKAYHPGRGVYRSSYRNALRLTATENNMAYRTADHLRWQQQPFVVGIEIKLSNNHTCKGVIGRFVDICDDLAGVYPKDFKFVGWHPHCRCYCVPKQASKEEFMEYQQRLLNGEDVSNYHFKGEVKDLPRNFKDWYTDNTDRIARAKSMPYFLRDNRKFIKPLENVELNRKTFDSFDSNKWEQTYFNNNNGGFVLTSKGRIATAKINKQEWQKFEKEQRMSKVLADNGYQIQHLYEKYGISSCDILIDGIKADLKSTASAGDLVKNVKHAFEKQGAKIAILEIKNNSPKMREKIRELTRKGFHGKYYFFGSKNLFDF